MNKFNIHEKAQILADTQSAYSLARRVVELEESITIALESKVNISSKMSNKPCYIVSADLIEKVLEEQK